jgi:hypothetical protein
MADSLAGWITTVAWSSTAGPISTVSHCLHNVLDKPGKDASHGSSFAMVFQIFYRESMQPRRKGL